MGMFLIHRCLIIFWSFHKNLLTVYYALEPNVVFDPQHQHAAQNSEGCVFTLTLLVLWKRERSIYFCSVINIYAVNVITFPIFLFHNSQWQTGQVV